MTSEPHLKLSKLEQQSLVSQVTVASVIVSLPSQLHSVKQLCTNMTQVYQHDHDAIL